MRVYAHETRHTHFPIQEYEINFIHVCSVPVYVILMRVCIAYYICSEGEPRSNITRIIIQTINLIWQTRIIKNAHLHLCIFICIWISNCSVYMYIFVYYIQIYRYIVNDFTYYFWSTHLYAGRSVAHAR